MDDSAPVWELLDQSAAVQHEAGKWLRYMLIAAVTQATLLGIGFTWRQARLSVVFDIAGLCVFGIWLYCQVRWLILHRRGSRILKEVQRRLDG